MSSFKERINALKNFRDGLKKFPQFEKNYFELENIVESADAPPTIMVIGEFSTGKSTFINALLGAEVADASAVAATAVITKISYGNADRIIAHFIDGTTKDYSAKDFAELTSDKDLNVNSMRKNLMFVERIFPAQILKNFTLIDSPGLTALNEGHEDITKNFLANSDALLWIMHTEKAAAATEVNLIKNLPERLKPVVIVNKMDEIDEEEEDPEDFLQDVRNKLKDNVRAVVGVSAHLALQGKLKKNSALLNESNLQEAYDKIKTLILDSSDDYKIKSLLKKFGMFLRYLAEDSKEFNERIEPLRLKVYDEFKKHSDAISKVRQLAENAAKSFYTYGQRQTDAETTFFVGILQQYGILLQQSVYEAKNKFKLAAEENIVEAQVMLGDFEKAANAGNAESQYQRALKTVSVDLLRNSASQNFFKAQYKLSQFLSDKNAQESLNWLKASAEHGYAPAQFELAKYYDGRDDSAALKWYIRAADKAIEGSYYPVGQMNLKGRGTPVNFEKAFEYHSKAAAYGNNDALVEMALAYYEGRGVKEDRVKAFSLLKNLNYFKASNILQEKYFNGSAENQFLIGRAYELGEGLPRDLNSAVDWYEKAARKNHVESIYRLSQYSKARNLSEYYRFLKQANDLGHAEASKEYHQLFNDAAFKERQYDISKILYGEESLNWLKASAEHGYAPAQFELAKYYDGRDDSAALKWYIRAADKAIEGSYYPVGQMNLKGRGTPVNFEKAFEYHSKAAAYGNNDALVEMALAYYEGRGVKEDRVKAFSLLKNLNYFKASNILQEKYFNGSAENQFLIGRAYELGEGLPRDLNSAVDWYEKAARKNHVESIYRLSQYSKARNLSEYYRFLKQANDLGHAEASKEYHQLFNDAAFKERQYDISKILYGEESLNWLKVSAEHGYILAQIELADRYKTGNGAPKSTWRAFLWYREANCENKNYDEVKSIIYKRIGWLTWAALACMFVGYCYQDPVAFNDTFSPIFYFGKSTAVSQTDQLVILLLMLVALTLVVMTITKFVSSFTEKDKEDAVGGIVVLIVIVLVGIIIYGLLEKWGRS